MKKQIKIIFFVLIIISVFVSCTEKDKEIKKSGEKNFLEGMVSSMMVETNNGLTRSKEGDKSPFTGTTYELYPNGKLRYKRTYSGGKLNGYSENYYDDGNLAEVVRYENGKIQGEVILFQKIIRQYNDGVIKEQTYYHTNGNKAHTTPLLPNWRAEGIQEHYWGDGKIRIKIPHKNGKRHGIAEYYKQDGTLEKTENYIDGQLQK